MNIDEIVERVSQDAISQIESLSLEHDLSLIEASDICRQVAMEIRARGAQFESESDWD